MEQRFEHIMERWFMTEPVLFAAIFCHERRPNTHMHCPLRCGQGVVEYNPTLLAGMSDHALEQTLMVEAIRILLKHPYTRKPEGCAPIAITLGSNAVVADNYTFGGLALAAPKEYGLPHGMNYEWYALKIQEQMNESPNGYGDNSDEGTSDGEGGSDGEGESIGEGACRDESALCEEDELMASTLNSIIEKVDYWGSLSGSMEGLIKASTQAHIDWRKALSGFRASILCSRRRLTRMRPNRRTGFQNMGSIHQLLTRLLIAVDVSGSITDQELAHFYGIIEKAFRYGIEQIDVVQFDVGLKSVESLKKVKREVAVCGRGGTSFQEPIDYANDNHYDSLVILTDGFATPPRMPRGMRSRTL